MWPEMAPGRTRTCDPRLLRNCFPKDLASLAIDERKAEGCGALAEAP
jgi:hypothetical protein